jgi:hypothetical protein
MGTQSLFENSSAEGQRGIFAAGEAPNAGDASGIDEARQRSKRRKGPMDRPEDILE